MPEDADRNRKMEALFDKGIREEHLTKKDIIDVFPAMAENREEFDGVVASLNAMGVPVIDLDEEDEEELLEEPETLLEEGEEEEEQEPAEEARARVEPEPINDPVRMYLREIGRVPLLDAEDEVRLAMAIQAGFVAAEELERAEVRTFRCR